jgi:hypothetical protein
LGVLLVGALLGLSDAWLHAQSTLTGRWEIVLSTQVGETTWVADIQQDGQTLTGEIDLGSDEVYPLTGMRTGDVISFEFIVQDPDGDQPVTMVGEVEGDRIQGEQGSFIWFGMGGWTGTRLSS